MEKQPNRNESEIEQRATEILSKDLLHNFKQLVEAGETPEAYIFAGRQMVRSGLHLMQQNAIKTGSVKVKEGGFRATRSGLFELESENDNYKKFVEVFNSICKQYDDLFSASDLQ